MVWRKGLEKALVLLALHFSTILFAFLIGMYLQTLIFTLVPDISKNVVFSTIIEQTRGRYRTSEALTGFFVFTFFLPLDFSVLYHASMEITSRKDIYRAIEKGFKDYPIFFMGFNCLYFFSLVLPYITPLILLAGLRRLEPEIPWKYHILSVVLFSAWLYPLTLTNRIVEDVLRRFLSFFFLMAFFLPFLGHANLINHIRKQLHMKRRFK